MEMTNRPITDAEVDAALRTLVAEGDDPALPDRVLRAIAGGSPRPRARWFLDAPGVFSLPRAVFAGGAAAAIAVLAFVGLHQDVGLPAPPPSPTFALADGAAPLPAPAGEVRQPAPVPAAYRPAPRMIESPAAPLIDPVPRPAPIEIQRLHTPRLEDERLQIQALTVEPLSIPPLDGD
jgi:hypothetical protein